MKTVNVEAASRLLSGAAFNAAFLVCASETPQNALPQAIAAFRLMAEGLLARRQGAAFDSDCDYRPSCF